MFGLNIPLLRSHAPESDLLSLLSRHLELKLWESGGKWDNSLKCTGDNALLKWLWHVFSRQQWIRAQLSSWWQFEHTHGQYEDTPSVCLHQIKPLLVQGVKQKIPKHGCTKKQMTQIRHVDCCFDVFLQVGEWQHTHLTWQVRLFFNGG